MKRIIINADDFGLSPGINRGIIELFSQGALSSTSLLVNMPGYEDALRLIKENQLLGVGIHINVMRGRPVSALAKVRNLCRGEFFRGNIFSLLGASFRHKEIVDEFAQECRAQIEKAISSGICITHVDSEKHIHIIKPFFQILLQVAREYGISKVRCINEAPYLAPHSAVFLNKQLCTALYLSFCSIENRKLLDQHQFQAPDYFSGVSMTGRMSLEQYIWTLSHLRDGSTELMCHPGYIDEAWDSYPLNRERYYINATRQKEMELLRSPKIKEIFKQQDIALMSYREL